MQLPLPEEIKQPITGRKQDDMENAGLHNESGEKVIFFTNEPTQWEVSKDFVLFNKYGWGQ